MYRAGQVTKPLPEKSKLECSSLCNGRRLTVQAVHLAPRFCSLSVHVVGSTECTPEHIISEQVNGGEVVIGTRAIGADPRANRKA